jgi:DNA replication and repair protein RecF
MFVEQLTASNFRNFESLAAEFSPAVNIFHGPNASGKTTILEAIFLLCLGRSQRSAIEPVLLRKDADAYRIEATIEREGKKIEVAAAYQKNVGKKLSIDKLAVKMSELYERFSAVSSGPEDTAIVSGPPSGRRTFMDIYLSQLQSTYLSTLSGYQRLIAQKTAALKQNQDVSAFNVLLADYGAQIMAARINLIDNLNREGGALYSEIASGAEFAVSYQPSVRIDDGMTTKAQLQPVIEETLFAIGDRESYMQACLAGPHRDELHLVINGLPARSHGSQGEWRTAALALKLAVYYLLQKKANTRPILLLDEIFAELDPQRQQSLIESFTKFGQVFITTALDPLPGLGELGRSFEINDGAIIGTVG